MEYSVLVVDDEMTVRQGLRTMIGRMEGWRWIGEASNGARALEQIERLSPDLVISDIRMPEMDGITLLEKIREFESHALVVFLTGYPDFEYAQQAVRFGAFEYLLKPMLAQDIAKTIRKAEAEIEAIRSRKRMEERYLRLSAESERWVEESCARNAIYGAADQLFDPAVIPFFRDSEYVTAASVHVEGQDSAVTESVLQTLRDDVKKELDVQTIVLKDGRGEWVLLMGWRAGETPEHRSNELQSYFHRRLQHAGGVWRAGIGCALPPAQCSVSYDQSRLAMLAAADDCTVVRYDFLSGTEQTAWLPPIELQFALVKCAKRGDTDEALEHYRQIKPYFLRMTPGELGKQAMQLYAYLQDGLHEMEERWDAVQPVPDFVTGTQHDILESLGDAIQRFASIYKSSLNRQMNHVVQRVVAFIRREYDRDLRLGDIASKLGVNASYLSTLFKQETGVLFTDYLSRYRIERSLSLLADPELKVYEVAQKVGYADGRHFSQLFRKTIGMTPFEYRNRKGIANSSQEKEYM